MPIISDEKAQPLTDERWSQIIRAVRAEDGDDPGFQISKSQMEIILREGNR